MFYIIFVSAMPVSFPFSLVSCCVSGFMCLSSRIGTNHFACETMQTTWPQVPEFEILEQTTTNTNHAKSDPKQLTPNWIDRSLRDPNEPGRCASLSLLSNLFANNYFPVVTPVEVCFCCCSCLYRLLFCESCVFSTHSFVYLCY